MAQHINEFSIFHTSGNSYKIVSRIKLDMEKLCYLRDMGLLGYGQEFRIHSKCDGTEEIVPQYTTVSPLGKDYAPLTYYVYEISNIVDSSD